MTLKLRLTIPDEHLDDLVERSPDTTMRFQYIGRDLDKGGAMITIGVSATPTNIKNGSVLKSINKAHESIGAKTARPELERLQDDFQRFFSAYMKSHDQFHQIRSRLLNTLRYDDDPELYESVARLLPEEFTTCWSDFGVDAQQAYLEAKFDTLYDSMYGPDSTDGVRD